MSAVPTDGRREARTAARARFEAFRMLCHLMPLIMIGQNLQGKHSEARAEADFEVNVRAEQEIEAILQHLENQNGLILKIISRLETDQK